MKKHLPLICAVLLIAAMTAAAEYISGEILFPEIAAVAAGVLIVPRPAWNTSCLKMFALLAIGAVCGTLISCTPLPLASRFVLAFLIALGMLLFSRTTFTPVVSAVVLPVMMQGASWVYPLSAALLAATAIGLHIIMEKRGLVPRMTYRPEQKPDLPALTDYAVCWALGSCVLLLAVKSKQHLLAAPPLLVAFTEFCKPGSKAQEKPFPFAAMLTGCAAVGTFLRLAAIYTHCPEFIAAGITITAVFLLMRKTGLYLPPAAALSILAYLLPVQDNSLLVLGLYPVQVLGGSCLLLGLAMLQNKTRSFYYVQGRRHTKKIVRKK